MKLRIDRSLKTFLKQWEKQPWLLWALSTLWLLLVCGLAFLWNLGSTGLVDETEPLFAEAARQMTVTGDWVTPYFNAETRFDKPPLIYWLMAIAYQIVGVNEWAVRLPSALAAIGLTGFGFYILKRYGFPSPAIAPDADPELSPSGRRINHQLWLSAWIGAALIALNPQTIAWARTGVSDMLLSGCLGSALFAFFGGYAQPDPKLKTRWYLAFYVLTAMAVLTKGPVGIVLPGLIIGAFLLYLGNLRAVLKEMRLIWGGLLFLGLTVPWYVLVIQANGQEYIDAFFGYHNFERFTSVVNHHSAPIYFYFLVVLLGFAPWSIYLPVAIARLRFWRRDLWQQQPRSAHLGLFALTWFAVIFAFFTVAVTKLPSYVLPLMPAAAILVGLLWSHELSHPRSTRSMQISHTVLLIFLLTLAGAILYSVHWLGDDPAMPQIPEVIQGSGILLWGSSIWLITALVGAGLLLSRHSRWIWVTTLVGFVVFVVLTVLPAATIMDAERQLPLRHLAATIMTVKQPEEKVIMVGFPKPSLVFYTQDTVTYLPDPDVAVNRIQRQFRRNQSPNSILMLGYPHKIEDTGLRERQYQVLDEAGAYQLIRVPLPIRIDRSDADAEDAD